MIREIVVKLYVTREYCFACETGGGGVNHLAKISENSGWYVNGKIIFRKFHPEILDYLLR